MSEVYWSWEASVKNGELENFKKLVGNWNIVAAADPATLFNKWLISEDECSVRVLQRFVNATAALEQFKKNHWDTLDNYLVPQSMCIYGDYGKTLDFLREHGATFMTSID